MTRSTAIIARSPHLRNGHGVRIGRMWTVSLTAAVLFTCLSEITAAGEADPVDAPAGPGHQDLLYLCVGRPVVIRLHLYINGEPFGRPWGRYAQRLFATADQNGDGRLTASEREAAASPDDPLHAELVNVLSTPGLLQSDVDPPDGVISLPEFAAFVADRRGGAFQAPRNASSAPSERLSAPSPVQNANAGAALFKALDVQGDGDLSISDLQSAVDSLRRLDFDSDGACSAEELDHLRSPFAAVPQPAAAAGQSGIPLNVLSPGEPSTALVERLLAAYGGSRSQPPDSLSIEQLGHRREDMSEFDADDDGRLDLEELRYWITHARPHVELTVRIGSTDAEAPPVAVKTPPTLEGLSVKVTPAGLVSLVDGAVQLEFDVLDNDRTEESLRRAFVQSFKMIDVDSNGYLDHDETARSPYFEAEFSRFDRDADAKVFEEELLAGATGEILTALARSSVTIANRGQDLFEILDSNRDRRVSRRELLDSVDRFALWDADDDGRLTEAEVPQLYQLQFERAAPPLPALAGANRRRRGANDAAMSGPVWFQRMDRNADGDVAFEEFIGTPEQFERLDANGDTLIDAAEAVLVESAE